MQHRDIIDDVACFRVRGWVQDPPRFWDGQPALTVIHTALTSWKPDKNTDPVRWRLMSVFFYRLAVLLGCPTARKNTVVRVMRALAEANILCEARHEVRLQRFLVHGAWYTRLCASLRQQAEGTVDVDCGPLLILRGNNATWERERKSSAIQFLSDVHGLLQLGIVQIAQESGASGLGKMLMDYLLRAAQWTEGTSPPLGLTWMTPEVDIGQAEGTADHHANQLGFSYPTPHAVNDFVVKINDAGQSTAAPEATSYGNERGAYATFVHSPPVSTSGPREPSTEHGGGGMAMGPPPARHGTLLGCDRRNSKTAETTHHGKTLTFQYCVHPITNRITGDWDLTPVFQIPSSPDTEQPSSTPPGRWALLTAKKPYPSSSIPAITSQEMEAPVTRRTIEGPRPQAVPTHVDVSQLPLSNSSDTFCRAYMSFLLDPRGVINARPSPP